MSDPIIESVIEKLRSRSVRGLDKYGVGLDREDLSVVQWLTHLQEELLDAAGYAEKLIQVMGGKKPKEEVYGPPPPTLQDSWKDMEKRMREAAEKWQERNKPEPIVYGPPPATIPKTTFDRDAVICRDGRDAHGPAPSEMQQLRNLEQEISKLPWTEEEKT